MGTSDGSGVGGNCSVGTIVWVRRRNGSWWPGRILGLHELSASHLMSPRSGTPVKLLGREDASVDWYNLEKSKRVKEFRCGEFDACIERAEASQSIPIKKREKYARREDAILHALELEKRRKLESTSNGAPKTDSTILSSPENFVRNDDFVALGDKKFCMDHDNAEATPRARGLQDVGLPKAQSRRKPPRSASRERSRKSIDGHVESFSSFDNVIDGADQASTSRNAVSIKRKRSCGGAIDEFVVKKRDRRRPLVQVLQSSAKLPPPCSFQPSCSAIGTLNTQETEKIGSTWKAKRSRCVYLPADSDVQPDHGANNSEQLPASANQFELCNDISISANMCEGYIASCLLEMNDTDYSEGDLLESNMLEETDLLTDTTDTLLAGSKDCEPPKLHASEEFRSLIHEDAPISSSILHLNEDPSFENGISKWRMKGKRNVRNAGKRLVDAVDLKRCVPDAKESSSTIARAETSGQTIPEPGFYSIKEEVEHAYDESDLIDDGLEQSQLVVQCNMESHPSLHDSGEDSHGLARNAFSGEPDNEVDPQLVEVELKVQMSYQGEHVPLVSLMSRLNGKAIIGHPIQIEILEDGSSNLLILSVQAMWWTARRTTMHRVPRPIPSAAALEEEDDANLFPHPLHKNPCFHYLNHRATKKFQKKNVRRTSLSSRKTRRLSSLASNEMLGGDKLTTSDADAMLGGSVPLVTTVPVRVVFSRILEAIGRPSSGFSSHVKTGSSGT